WLLWMMADSALPTGGFVASSGLEASVQAGYVHNEETLLKFISSSVHNYALSTLPFVTKAYEISQSESTDDEKVEQLIKLDDFYEASTSNAITKRASKAQGTAMLMLLSKSFGQLSKSVVGTKLKLQVRLGRIGGHLPVCFGMACQHLNVSLSNTQELFLFLFVRAIISAAVRLNLVGPYYAQTLLAQCQEFTEEAWKLGRDVQPEDAAQSSPLLDIIQGTHDHLYSRIFNS
ncbi:urease accessory protein UreF, partial [Basidiobolus meristosporus CBS 931.73]